MISKIKILQFLQEKESNPNAVILFTATEMEKIELLERMNSYLKSNIHKLGTILISGANISVSLYIFIMNRIFMVFFPLF